jgi:tRNA dimethylallyltransferase
MPTQVKNAVLIAGPTASGKSALALAIARERGGVIVNADSMQVYAGLRVLTARPSVEDEAQAPHHLYGHADPATAYSTGAWLRDVARLIEAGIADGHTPIFVGGTGLYFRALEGGLSDMPEVPEATRARWRYELSEKGAAALHRLLAREDADIAARLSPNDGQRIVRALEVLEATGKSIGFWQARQGTGLIDKASAEKIVLEPDRMVLAGQIETRMRQMVDTGALEEVRALLARRLDPAAPVMKAIGVRPLSRHLAGECDMETAIAEAAAETRQYAKRQMTWFRNQLDERWRRAASQSLFQS